MEKIEVIKTEDGSDTLYIPQLDETYHSTHGAIQEAQHVFIKNGIQSFEGNEISILEIGFGTGLNAILTCLYSKKDKRKVSYVGIESNPLSLELVNKLNYKQEIKEMDVLEFNMLHQSISGETIQLSSNFDFTKVIATLQDYITDIKFDIIYYDAFGPRAQKEMWEKPLFEKLYTLLNPKGRLVTYCAMGQFKRDLKSCGYKVEALPGPPGKREMTVAHKLN